MSPLCFRTQSHASTRSVGHYDSLSATVLLCLNLALCRPPSSSPLSRPHSQEHASSSLRQCLTVASGEDGWRIKSTYKAEPNSMSHKGYIIDQRDATECLSSSNNAVADEPMMIAVGRPVFVQCSWPPFVVLLCAPKR